MNILQIDISNKSIDNFIKNKNIKLIFISNHINGTRNHIIKKLKYIVDLKYHNYNFFNIDKNNRLLIIFKNNIDIYQLNILINNYNKIKKILKKNNIKKSNINKLYTYIYKFYLILFEINNDLRKDYSNNKKKLIKKFKNIELLLYIKYILSKDDIENLNYNFKKIKKIYKDEKDLFIFKEIKEDYNDKILKDEIKIGLYSTNCFCINNYVKKIKDKKFKIDLVKKLYNYEKKYMSI